MDISALAGLLSQLAGLKSGNAASPLSGLGRGTTQKGSAFTFFIPVASPAATQEAVKAPTAADVQAPLAPAIVLPDVIQTAKDTYTKRQSLYSNQVKQTQTNFSTGNLGNFSLLDQPTLLGS